MIYLSQRDSKWKDIKIGETNSTIGRYGCLITAIAIVTGTTPDVVNARLKEVKGFQDDLVIWSKIPEALPGVEFRKLSSTYDNNVVRANLPCLVRVDGSPIGSSQHWVVYIGNQQMIDPWFGEIKPTSFYVPNGYAIIKGSYQLPTNAMNEWKEKLQNYSGVFYSPDDVIRFIEERKREIEAKDKVITDKDAVIAGQSERMQSLSIERDTLLKQLEEAQAEAKKNDELRDKWYQSYVLTKDSLESCNKDRSSFQGQLTELQNKSKPINKFLLKLYNLIMGIDEGIK